MRNLKLEKIYTVEERFCVNFERLWRSHPSLRLSQTFWADPTRPWAFVTQKSVGRKLGCGRYDLYSGRGFGENLGRRYEKCLIFRWQQKDKTNKMFHTCKNQFIFILTWDFAKSSRIFYCSCNFYFWKSLKLLRCVHAIHQWIMSKGSKVDLSD